MKRKVLIAGAGQLGSRYLQGLSKVDEPLEIHVYDLLRRFTVSGSAALE